MNASRATAAFAPAARRAMSTAAAGGKGTLKDIWAVAEAVPLVVMVAIPSSFAVYTCAKFATTHNECQWSKTTKSKGVSSWYESKYPGTEAVTKSGANFSHGAH